MYKNNFVAVVKVNGKVLREKGNKIFIPFGSEYTLMLENLNIVKAVVRIQIDGKNIAGKKEFIINSGSKLELEGFLKNTKVTNKFKFIERTKRIEKYRGVNPCDGLITVSYRFERIDCAPLYPLNNNFKSMPIYGPIYGTKNTCDESSCYSNSQLTNCTLKQATTKNDIGITVKGSKSNQRFKYGSTRTLERQEHVIVLQLKGKTKNKKLNKVILTKSKICCETCGKKNKTSNNYCVECGTALF